MGAFFMSKNKSDIQFEAYDWKQHQPGYVFGVDEVGRGCLAGPVYAAACILKSDEWSDSMTDSKLLTAKKRDYLSEQILQSHDVAVAFATVEEIDELNILQASLLAMKRAVEALEEKIGQRATMVLVDGSFKIPDLSRPQNCVVKGDLRCSPISAASIVAKVTRDRLMQDLGEQYPGYGLEKHKGYASAVHKQAIQNKGPTPIHRKSFSGVKEFLA